MKLRNILRELTLPELEEMMQFWELSPEQLPKDIDPEMRKEEILNLLCPRMQNEQVFHLTFRRLPEDEKRLFHFLYVNGGVMGEKELKQRFGKKASAKIDTLTAPLAKKGFLNYDRLSKGEVGEQLICIPDVFLRFVELPSYWEGYLGHFLQQLSFGQLKKIVQVGLKRKLSTFKKNNLIYEIRQGLLHPKKLKSYIESMPNNERRIFKLLASEANGTAVYRNLLEKGSQKKYDHAKADYINNLLTYSGVVYIMVSDQNKYNSLLMIPRDVFYIIQNRFQKPDLRSLDELDTVTVQGMMRQPKVTWDNANNIMRDLVVLAAFIGRNNVRALSSGGIGKNELRKVLPYLSKHKRVKYANFLALFLITNRFIVEAGGVWKVSDALLKWLRNSPQGYLDLYRFWLRTTDWNEEYVDGDVKHGQLSAAPLVNITELRKLVLKELETLPHHQWINFVSFVQTLISKVEIKLPRRTAKYLTDKNNRSNYLVIESVVAETLYWLGLIAVGASDATKLKHLGGRTDEFAGSGSGKATGKLKKSEEIRFYFRLTGLGKFILESDYLEPEKLFIETTEEDFMPLSYQAKHFTLQPNLEVLTPPDLELPVLYHLCCFSDVKSLDVMSTMTISKESVRNALEKGLSANQVLEFLQQNSRSGVPETVKHLVRECSEKFGEIHIGYAGGYLIVEDPVRLEEMKSLKPFQQAIKEIINSKVVLLKPNINLKRFAREIQRLGFMPRLEAETIRQTTADNYYLSLTRDELYYLLALLKLITEIEKDLGAEITENRASSLAEHFGTESQGFGQINVMAEAVTSNFFKIYHQALKQRIERISSRYKKQISRLMTAVASRTPSKFSYTGPNPAESLPDILKLLEYAIDNEMKVRLTYRQPTKQQTAQEVIEPESMDRTKVFGFNERKDSYGVYLIKRIEKVKLI